MTKEEIKEEKVEVSKGLLDSIQKELKDLKADREMFMEMADERKKALYYSRHQEQLPANVFIRTMIVEEKGQAIEKVIVGWNNVKDDKILDPRTGRQIGEEVIINLIFDDGTSKEIGYAIFNRLYKQVKTTVVSRKTDELTGNTILKVKRIDNGKEYEIGIAFIN